MFWIWSKMFIPRFLESIGKSLFSIKRKPEQHTCKWLKRNIKFVHICSLKCLIIRSNFVCANNKIGDYGNIKKLIVCIQHLIDND